MDTYKKPELEKAKITNNQKEWDEDYVITALCYGCRKCVLLCPAECIKGDSVPFYIDGDKCIRCGNCKEVCPVSAVQLI